MQSNARPALQTLSLSPIRESETGHRDDPLILTPDDALQDAMHEFGFSAGSRVNAPKAGSRMSVLSRVVALAMRLFDGTITEGFVVGVLAKSCGAQGRSFRSIDQRSLMVEGIVLQEMDG